MIPNAKVTKLDGNTSVVKPGAKGIFAIIGTSSSGTANVAGTYSKISNALADDGYGTLTDAAAYIMAQSGNPVVLIKGSPSQAGVAGTPVKVGTGTALAATLPTGSVPIDDFSNAGFTIVLGGTVGAAGITYTYSLDGGITTSAQQQLGTATSITIPNSGVVYALGTGTFVAGDSVFTPMTGPRLSTSDLTVSLEALRISSQPWEMVLVVGHDATATTVTILDTWLAAREAEGRYRGFVVNAPAKAATTEAAYLAAMQTAWTSVASIRGCVGADVGDLASSVPGRGIVQQRPASLALAGRVASVQYGIDPALVSTGPVNGFGLADVRGNPKNHDENAYPGLDALRLMTLRSFDRKAGTFITNANVISTQGSDYVWIQHIRTMNRACEIAFDTLTSQLSRGVRRSPKVGPNGEVYIAEEDAQRFDALVNQALAELRGQVSDLRFTLSRNDNIGSNGPVILNGDLKIAALAYVKEFDTNAAFVRTVTISS